jgi:DHA1 family bicyclomycin/chloramphenicol resistance-like MFS transporter
MEKVNGQRLPGHTKLLFVLAAMTMFVPMSIDMYMPSFPAVADALGVHIVELQLTLSSFMLGTGLGQIIYGPISDRFGRKKPSYFGILIFLIASLLCTTATTLPALIGFRFLQAFGGSAALVCARAIVRDLLSGVEMSKMMSAMSMLFVLAPAFAPTIGSTILHWTSWHGIFYALILFGALVALGLLTIPESLPQELRNDHGFRDAFRAYRQILKNHEFRAASVVTMGGSFVTFAYVSSSPAVLMGEYGVSRSTFGILFGLISIGLLASSRINIKFVAKFGIQKMLLGFTAAQTTSAAIVLLCAIFHAPLWALLVFVIICFGCAPGMGGNAMTMALHPFPEKAASAAAMLGMLQMFASGLIGALLSFVHSHIVINMGIAMFVGALMAFTQVRRIKQSL